jgi:hypothetical protein
LDYGDKSLDVLIRIVCIVAQVFFSSLLGLTVGMKRRSSLSLSLPVEWDSTHVEAQDREAAREELWLLIGKDF